MSAIFELTASDLITTEPSLSARFSPVGPRPHHMRGLAQQLSRQKHTSRQPRRPLNDRCARRPQTPAQSPFGRPCRGHLCCCWPSGLHYDSDAARRSFPLSIVKSSYDPHRRMARFDPYIAAIHRHLRRHVSSLRCDQELWRVKYLSSDAVRGWSDSTIERRSLGSNQGPFVVQ